MSMRTMLLRLLQETGTTKAAHLSAMTGLTPPEISKMRNGDHAGNMRLETLRRIADNTQIPIGTLAEWWAEPDTVKVADVSRKGFFPDRPQPIGEDEAMARYWHSKIGPNS